MSDIDWPVSDEEIATAQRILAKLQPGYLPLPIFLETARLSVLSVVELVPLQWRDGKVQILLIDRDTSNGPLWPDETVHVPGTVIRATDGRPGFQDALERLLVGELGGVATKGEPRYVTSLFHHSGRGKENTQVFYVEIAGEPSVGRFYEAEPLPATIMRSQRDFIPAAIEAFRADHATGRRRTRLPAAEVL